MALLRIFAGLLFFSVRLVNLPYIVAFYGDSGYLPRDLFWQSGSGQHFSLFFCSGGEGITVCLYLISMACALALALGWKTRWMTLACWIFASSLEVRNPYGPASDFQLQLCFLWGFFLPWGELWSLDARKRGSRPSNAPYVSVATFAWRLQVALIYVGAALGKNSSEWGQKTAVEISLFSDMWSSPMGRGLGKWALQFPGLLEFLNEAVIWGEFFLPLLLFVPWWPCQALALILLSLMHLVFGVCFHIETFSFVSVGLLVGFLPTALWTHFQSLEWRLDRALGGVGSHSLSRPGPSSSAWVSWMLAMMLWANLDAVRQAPVRLTPPAREILGHLGLIQSWMMFVPPPARGGWYVFRGQTLSGDWVNLIGELPLEGLDSPEDVSQTLPNTRLYLLFNARLRPGEQNARQRQAVARYLQRRWESRHPEPLQRLKKIELVRWSREYKPGQGFTAAERKLLFQSSLPLSPSG